MRYPAVLLLLLCSMACGHNNSDPQAPETPLLPGPALNVAWFAVAQANTPLLTLSLDPSIEADLSVYEHDGCVQDSTSPSPLNANDTVYTLTRSYSHCGNGIQSAALGTRVVKVDNSNNTHVVLNSNFNLQLAQGDDGMLSLASNTNVTMDGSAASGTITRVYASQGTWTDPGVGNVQQFTHALTITDTYDVATQLPTRSSLTGTFDSGYENSPQAYQVTYSELVLQPAGCCLPVGGSITDVETFDDGSTQHNVWVFSGTCGSFTVNGEPYGVVTCP